MENRSDNQNNIEHPILKKLPKELKQEILRVADEKSCPAGATVFGQGDPGDCFL